MMGSDPGNGHTPSQSLSLIIPVHNGGEKFIRCLESVSALAPAFEQVIVVVDGDDDGSGEIAGSFGFTVIQLALNKGPAHARNIGAKAATGDILVFLDADITVSPGSIETIATLFEKNPEFCALFGSYDDAPFEPGVLSQYRNLLHHFVHQTGNREASTFWAGCGAVLRSVFLNMGGFNASAYSCPAIEDIELGYRLKKAGHRIGLIKELQVKHLKKWDFASIALTDFFNRALPWTRLILKENRMINDLNLKITARISVVCALLTGLCLVLSTTLPLMMIPALLFGCALVAFNLQLYLFFAKKRGFLFMFTAILMHWGYYLISAIAFGWGWTEQKAARLKP